MQQRVLHVVSAMNRGGAETLLMNVYRHIDRRLIQFDFVSHRHEKGDYDDEIRSLGGRIYRIPSLGTSGPFSYVKQLQRIMQETTYTAVHAHTDYQGGFAALAAKRAGVNIRICHSHSNHWEKGNRLKEKALLQMLRKLIHYAATDFCSCSEEAARFLFGHAYVKNEKVRIVRNGIETAPFTKFHSLSKQSVRKELRIPEQAIILGHVGGFSPTKNQPFILRVLDYMRNAGKHAVAVFVGAGKLQADVKDEAERLGLLEHVRFLGVRDDIPRLMKSFDVFVFPSHYEGFGIVTLEAQCAGVPCIVSDTVPKTTDLGLGLLQFVSLEEDLSIWSEKIEQAMSTYRPNPIYILTEFARQGYDIRHNIHDWLKMYGVS